MKTRMRNTFKRLLSILAAIVVTLGIVGANAVPAMAADNLTITIQDTQNNQTYTVYKLFDATVNQTRAAQTDNDKMTDVQTEGISYTVPSGKDLSHDYTYTGTDGNSHTVNGGKWFTTDNGGNVKTVVNFQDSELATEDFQNWAVQFGTQQGTAWTNSSNESSHTFTGLTDGYYFIKTTTGSLLTVTSIAPNALVRDKNTVPEVNKTESVKTSDVGDTVTYTIDISLTPGASNVIFHDRIADGLLLGEQSTATVTVGGSTLDSSNYDIVYWNNTKSTNTSNKSNGDNITISFKESYLNTITTGTTTVVLSYPATVNTQGFNMSNEAYVTYGDSDTETTKRTVYESTFGFSVNKVDNNNTNLAGAVFALSKDGTLTGLTVDNASSNASLLGFTNNVYDRNSSNKTVTSTTTTDQVIFSGLNDNDNDSHVITYYLYEIKAPDGYNKLTEPVKIQIKPTFEADGTTNGNSHLTSYTVEYKLSGESDAAAWHQAVTEQGGNTVATAINARHNIDITNTAGSALPSTGGIGTTIFYVIGGVLVAGAIVLLVVRRRRNA